MHERAQGAILGAFIGDALGLGPHWYYDLSELRADYGEWIDDYTDPKSGRYHDWLKADQLSQSGYILTMMTRSLNDCGGYDESDFCKRLDGDLFPQLDGTPMSGPGLYTSQFIRDVWQQKTIRAIGWQDNGSNADTTEAIERTLVIGMRYATRPAEMAAAIDPDIKMDPA
ncbi:ADP-ribosylglycohydrolase family protein [Desulfosediminicola flagellatus]|uniref:ADP-ribosylglycohydrolase family protein n=1 Tax=Desulfosediminicola flagellatus TaxID=2569541 RepID=UPI0010AB7C3D|nr:ADP-ribosylglycohydrolase family protein [Desulfosediminicola flagellatus]